MRLRVALSLLNGVAAAVIVVTVMQAESPFPIARQLAADAVAPEGAFVLLGDSIFEGLDASALGPGVLNFGISGDTSRGLLNRIDRYRSLAKARAIVLEIGINDLAHQTGDDIAANYRQILAALSKEPRLYLIGILPIDEAPFMAAKGVWISNAEIAQINTAAAELCQQRGNCVLLQPFGTGSLRSEYHIGDGLHLSEAGYAVLAGALKAALVAL
jgi:lysophospholipase L1-like esterase